MARSFSYGPADFAPNADGTPQVYPDFAVDRFTRADTSALEWTAAVDPSWPTDPSVLIFTVRCVWDNGDNAEWRVTGGRRNRDGTPATVIRERIYVPQVNDGSGGSAKVAVASGTMTLTAYVPFRSTFTLAAVA